MQEIELLTKHHRNQDYANCALSLKTLNPLYDYFVKYEKIRMIKYMIMRLSNIKKELGDMILREFKEIESLTKELMTDDDKEILLKKTKKLSLLSVVKDSR